MELMGVHDMVFDSKGQDAVTAPNSTLSLSSGTWAQNDFLKRRYCSRIEEFPFLAIRGRDRSFEAHPKLRVYRKLIALKDNRALVAVLSAGSAFVHSMPAA